MNLTINTQSFCGKKEVMYGIKRAAYEARNAEISRSYQFGPRPASREWEVKFASGALSAYSDMVVNDSTFLRSVKKIGKNDDFMYSLLQILQPKNLQYGEISPFEKFSESMLKSAKNTDKTDIIVGMKEFIDKIGL